MTTGETPTQPGLTRTVTDYPAEWWFGPGWYYTAADMRAAARRAKARGEQTPVELDELAERIRASKRGNKSPMRIGRKLA